MLLGVLGTTSLGCSWLIGVSGDPVVDENAEGGDDPAAPDGGRDAEAD